MSLIANAVKIAAAPLQIDDWLHNEKSIFEKCGNISFVWSLFLINGPQCQKSNTIMLHIVCLLALTFMKVEWLKEATFNLDRAYHFSDNLRSNLVAKNWWFPKL